MNDSYTCSDYTYLYPGILSDIRPKGNPGFQHSLLNYANDCTYEQHLKYLTDYISKPGFTKFKLTSYVFQALINEIFLYNQNDENIFIKRVKNGRTDNTPPFYISFDNLFWDSLPSIGVFPIQFYREEKMLESKLSGKPIDVLLSKYNLV